MKKEVIDKNTLAHTSWNCKYHVVFGQSTDGKCFSKENAPKLEIYSGNYANGRGRR